MEAAADHFVSRVVTLLVLFVISYGVITVAVHQGLRSVIAGRALRQGLVQLLSVVAFGVIGYFVLHAQ